MYIYYDTYYFNKITQNIFNRQKSINKTRKKSRRNCRNYMNLHLKLLTLHSENDTFINRYWLANNIAKYLIKYKLSTEFGNATKTLLYLKTLIQNKQPNTIQFYHYVECLDMIEKLIYNTIEGCMNLPLCNDEAALKFFVGNRKVCQMYFRRELRTPLVNSLYKYGISTTTLIHQSSQCTGYSWTRFIRYLQNAKYDIIKLEKSLIHTVHHNLFIFAYGLMNINDIPALIGIKEYFSQQVYDAEQTDAMIENAKGNVENAIKLYFRFIQAHIIDYQTENNNNKEHKINIDDEQEEEEKVEQTEDTFFTKTFLNNISHLGLKCCIDAQDWTSYNELYQLLNKTFENNLNRLSEIRGYNIDYIESLSLFDQNKMNDAAKCLTKWELNLGVNPLKSATIPTTTREDLFKTADMYHLQALLLSITNNNNNNINNNNNDENNTQNNKI
eukprot:518395_1